MITSEAPGSSNAGLYVERALAVADDGRAFAVSVQDGQAFSALSPQQFGQPGALILLGTNTLDRDGRDRVAGYLRDGGRVLLTLGPDIDIETLPGVVGTHPGVDPKVLETSRRRDADRRRRHAIRFSGPSSARPAHLETSMWSSIGV